MKAMQLQQTGIIERDSSPLQLVEVDTPTPATGEVLLAVKVCGVCHTELDEIEGRLTPPVLPVIPGHQVIGTVCELGAGTSQYQIGDRVGVGWIHHSDGTVLENLSEAFKATGCDVNGGYSEFMTVPEHYAVPVPDVYDSATAAPLLCAGAIGYRALKLTELEDGEALGLMGFGGSAHLVLQLARHQYPNSPIYVFARAAETREFALQLGADWAGDTDNPPPERCNAIIDTTPAWRPLLAALGGLAAGGRLIINAIRKDSSDQSALLELSYHEHLWMERIIRSVANITRQDIAEFLPLAAAAGIRPATETYPLQDANAALMALKFAPTLGAKVLHVSD